MLKVYIMHWQEITLDLRIKTLLVCHLDPLAEEVK
jgi:hypothetical protein